MLRLVLRPRFPHAVLSSTKRVLSTALGTTTTRFISPMDARSRPFTTTSSSNSSPVLSWIDTNPWIPAAARPYLHLARADKQVGTMLLLWPCCWSTALAAPAGALPDVLLMGTFALGALVMRGAGCTINDLWDQDYDKHVERTKHRPLASGQLTTNQALVFLGGQLTVGLGVLMSFDVTCLALGMSSMPLVVLYPLCKRFTNWPQLVLGLAFNWGALMGWPALHAGELGLVHTLPLYAAGVCWTLVYDTLYGYQVILALYIHTTPSYYHTVAPYVTPSGPVDPLSSPLLVYDTRMSYDDQDRRDDAKLGLKSTSLTLGDHPQVPLTALTAGVVGGLLMAGHSVDIPLLLSMPLSGDTSVLVPGPFVVGVTGVGAHLLWQIWTADVNDPKNLWRRFHANQYTGAAVLAAIVAGKLTVG